jgi:hypothetical protein
MKPVHAVVAGLFALFWIGLLAFVLTHGKDDDSGVDVYSELPPGFTAALQTKGVTYTGLSPVDSATVAQVLSHATTADLGGGSTGDPIVLRTAFSDSTQGSDLQDRAALMVVVPGSQASDGAVHVAFLDPASYTTLATVSYDDSDASG